MEKIKLDPETSALILVDLQHGIVALETRPHPAFSVVAKAASLAATFRKHGSPVIYVRVDLANMLQVPADRSHGDPKNPPPAIASELVPASGVQAGDLVVTKRHWSAFSGTDLEERTGGREDGCDWRDNNQLRSRVNRPCRCGLGLWSCVR
jgi:nicotinamidase-related amidase